MNYEQKYKEALNRAERMLSVDASPETAKLVDNCIKKIFPELKEDKDKKMIKAIIHILYENYTDAAIIEGVEIAEIVTGLKSK